MLQRYREIIGVIGIVRLQVVRLKKRLLSVGPPC